MSHVLEPAKEYVPAGHAEMAVAARKHEYPAGHVVHTAAPAKEYVPSSQTWGSDAGLKQEWPAGHNVHTAWPTTAYVASGNVGQGTGMDAPSSQ